MRIFRALSLFLALAESLCAALVDHRIALTPEGRTSELPKNRTALALQLLEREFQSQELPEDRTAVALQVLDREFQKPTTRVSHKSWIQRLGNAVWSVVLGIFGVIPFSVAFLWVNERRNAQLESLISRGQSEAETIESHTADLGDYDGCLVHMNAETARGLDPVSDGRFPAVKFDSGCIRLTSTVEVYQWNEEKHTEKKKDNVGGGETTTTTYSYHKEWSLKAVSSDTFQEPAYENSLHVKGLNPGSHDEINSTVKYGENHYLPRDLATELTKVENAGNVLGKELKFGSYNFNFDGEYYQCPVRMGPPEIGDFRVKFEYVRDHPASVLALQVKDKHRGGHTFGPYRSVPRGLCGTIAPSQLKQTLLDAAKKDSDELYEEQKCLDFGPFACLCCCCNLVTYCFTHMNSAGLLYPQIFSAWSGELSRGECFGSEKMASAVSKWSLRFIGWALLWIGFGMIFEPLEVILDIIPFLGPYLGSGISYAVTIFTLVLTVILATFIVSLAYLMYHPLVGLAYLVLTAGIAFGAQYVAQLLQGS